MAELGWKQRWSKAKVLRSKVEERLKGVWEHRITACVLGVAAFGAVCTFLRHSPVPGVAIAVLGVVAAVMSIRTLSPYEKFFWTLMAFGLLYAEIRAIRVDRSEANKHALEDRQRQYNNFLTLSQQQQKLASGFGGLRDSLEKQFSHTVPVQTFGKREKSKPAPIPASSSPSPQPSRSGSLTITQQDDVSTRTDAPYKIKVTIQTTVEMPTLKLILKCNVPLVEAQGGPTGSGMLMMTSQGISNADHSVWFMQYGNAIPPFGPSNPIVVSIWTVTPAICDQAATF